jgi:hypothetical protein
MALNIMQSQHEMRQAARVESRRSSHALAFVIFAVFAVLVSCGKKEESAPPSPDGVSSATNAASSDAVRREFARLVGVWKRKELHYVLEIKSVDPTGTMDATYDISRPIALSRASAVCKNGVVKLFIELKDEKLSGSTYRLTYNPKADQLEGIYYQSAFKKTYSVTFERMK